MRQWKLPIKINYALEKTTNTTITQPGSHNHFRPEDYIVQQSLRQVLKSIENNLTAPLNTIYKQKLENKDSENYMDQGITNAEGWWYGTDLNTCLEFQKITIQLKTRGLSWLSKKHLYFIENRKL